MNLERRLRALEARVIMDPVILHFKDGSTRELAGQGDFLLNLFHGASQEGEVTAEQAQQLTLIRQSVSAEEPDGGHMVELLRALLNGPAEPTAEMPSDVPCGSK